MSNIYNGCVKWYNKKKGYGFITCIEGENKDKDFFIHYKNIITNNYKILYSGEYVSFKLENIDNKLLCKEVTGYNGGNLLADNSEYYYKAIKRL